LTTYPLSTTSEAPPDQAAAIESLLGSLHLPAGRLTPSELQRVAHEVARRPELWDDLVVDSPDVRWWLVLHNGGNFEVRLLSWEFDQTSGWHDHGGSSGGFYVTAGRLEERSRAGDGVSLRQVQFGPGDEGCFGPAHVHDVSHVAGHPAVSIHAYSPPLTYLTMYDETPLGLVVREVVADSRPLA
jgi:mannose-6-phosphate isomerase-like protein (cupin superfamily)